LVKARICIEGGGDSKELGIRLQQAFTKLIEKIGLKGRMPGPRWGGGRDQTFDKFKIAHRHASKDTFVAMLIDSEEPVEEIEKPWDHLKKRDNWDAPSEATDDQALLMVVCMETWIVSDRATLKTHYGSSLQESALPPLTGMESRDRETIQNKLVHATRSCANAYSKGKRSFEVVGKLNPGALRGRPSFERFERVLQTRLR